MRRAPKVPEAIFQKRYRIFQDLFNAIPLFEAPNAFPGVRSDTSVP